MDACRVSTFRLNEEDANMSSCIEKERQALLDVKASLSDLDGELYNWGSEEENMDCCKWVCVRCSNDTGHVIGLDLSFYGFTVPACKDVTEGCPLPSEEVAQFLDNALVTWKGKERSFERTSLQLLKSIDLSRNNFFGKLPHEITSLYDLASLNISINKLHGEVPNDMGRLKALQSLDLSRNEFSGRIPWSLSQLNFLSVLDLSYNNLSGRIPTGTQLQSFNYTSYSGNPQLCGPPLTPRCGFPPVAGKKDVEEDEDDIWISFYTGMGAGFAVGFSGTCGALFLSRRCRCVFFAWLNRMKDWIYVVVVVHFGKLGRKFRK